MSDAIAQAEPAVAPRRGRPVSLAKREAMIEAAIEEFGVRGFDLASVDAVAAKAGVSKRTLYNHFESKEGLFVALVQEVARRIQFSSRLDYAADRPLREQLRAFAANHRRLNSQRANVLLQRAVLAEHLRHPERVEPVLEGFWATEYGFLSWVEAAQRDGRLRGDPVRISHMMGSLMRSLLFWPALIGRRLRRGAAAEADVDEAIDMFLSYYASPREKAR